MPEERRKPRLPLVLQTWQALANNMKFESNLQSESTQLTSFQPLFDLEPRYTLTNTDTLFHVSPRHASAPHIAICSPR